MENEWTDELVTFLNRHLQAHPKIAQLFPGLEGVPLSSLPYDVDLLTRFRPRVHHALNFIINNLDSPALLEAALPRLNAMYKMYVDYVTPQQQNKVNWIASCSLSIHSLIALSCPNPCRKRCASSSKSWNKSLARS